MASSTRAAGTSGTSDSDTSRLSMAAHVSGTCWPCVFYPTTRGCMRGDRCAYCHFNHPITMLERRVRKRTRDKIKRKLSEILNPPVDLATWLIVDTFSRSRLRLFLSLSLSLHSFVVKLLLLLHDSMQTSCSFACMKEWKYGLRRVRPQKSREWDRFRK